MRGAYLSVLILLVVLAALMRDDFALTAIYLLVLTSLVPGDIVVGLVLASALVVAARATGPRRSAAGWRRWVVAVGTTTLRALESAARGGSLQAGARETDIFITPGFEFRVVDRLVTNFHLPRSTLMMLVSAFAGHAHVMALYAHAVRERYRFFSYGDAMLLARETGAAPR